jgi:hypothetical protein
MADKNAPGPARPAYPQASDYLVRNASQIVLVAAGIAALLVMYRFLADFSQAGHHGLLYGAGGSLMSLLGQSPQKSVNQSAGVADYAALEAAEIYLVAGVLLSALLFAARALWGESLKLETTGRRWAFSETAVISPRIRAFAVRWRAIVHDDWIRAVEISDRIITTASIWARPRILTANRFLLAHSHRVWRRLVAAAEVLSGDVAELGRRSAPWRREAKGLGRNLSTRIQREWTYRGVKATTQAGELIEVTQKTAAKALTALHRVFEITKQGSTARSRIGRISRRKFLGLPTP